ncbi:MAG: CotH kinase family protein [Clostridia bacterium]|nr:CotH kinase family protein [Clostridia bacterium]
MKKLYPAFSYAKKLSPLICLMILGVFVLLFMAETAAAAGISEDNQLPVIEIQTQYNRPISSKDRYAEAEMSLTDGDEVFSFGIQIRGRGNTTWGLPKKPYRIKLNEKADLLGLGESRHWILLANHYDGSHLRNKLSYDLSAAMGMTAVDSTFVNLIVNGEYVGLYQLSENIRPEKDRVPVHDWEDVAEDAAAAIADKEEMSAEAREALTLAMEQDLSWITSGTFDGREISDYISLERYDTTGGYILELDEYYDEVSKFTTPEDVPIMIKSPEYLKTNDEMFGYIREWVVDMEEAMFAPNGYNSKGKHYSEYVDVDSFVDYWIVNQVFKSVELLYKSCFMYKPADGKLFFGPVWDMDWSSGNRANLADDGADPCSWTHQYSQDREYWYRALYDQPSFMTRIQDRWWEIRPLIDDMMASIDPLTEELAQAAEDNSSRWGTRSFDKETADLSEWLTARIAWMDEQLSLRNPDIAGLGIEESRAYSITVTDENGNALPEDTVSDERRRADLHYDGTGDLRIRIDTHSRSTEKVELYSNGLLVQSLSASKGVAEDVLDPALLITDGRRNVIHAVAYIGAQMSTVAGERYVTITAEAPPVTETAEPAPEPAADEPAVTEPDKPVSPVLILIPAAGAGIAAAAIVILIRKRKK